MSTRKHRRHEKPLRRVYEDGTVVWVARFTDRHGKRRVYAPEWNRRRGTFTSERAAKDAIAEAYEVEAKLPITLGTVGGYVPIWLEKHPRAARTNDTNRHRISRVLDVEVEGRKFREWRLHDVRRRHIAALVDALLSDQRRSRGGATNILRSLSAMWEDAISDEFCDVNPVRGVKIRANDPRIRKQPRPVRVWTFEEMHTLAAAAGRWEPMLRVFSDTGMRLGEVLALHRVDLVDGVFTVRRTAHEGVVQGGTKTDHGEATPGRRVPCPPTLERMIRDMPVQGFELLFPTQRGKVWRERNWYRDVLGPAREATGMDIRPHEMRHSFVTHLRAAGVDDADLAAIAGHTVGTMIGHYTHALHRSHDDVRGIIG